MKKRNRKKKTNQNKKKKSQVDHHHVSYPQLVLIGIIVIAGLLVLQLTEEKIIIPLEENLEGIEEQKQLPDFSSKEEGTFSAWTQPTYYKEPIDNTVVLFSSQKIPGLALVYYPQENTLVGGVPPMVVPEISLFDGQPHHLGYVFKNNGEQGIFYDGNLIALSTFVPKKSNFLTGMVTGIPQKFISKALDEVEIS